MAFLRYVIACQSPKETRFSAWDPITRLAGITDEKAYKKADEICQLLGQFFQIQDDYLDVF